MSKILPQIAPRLFLMTLMGVIAASCTYRFVNQGITLRSGIRSVAVESVFDTGQETIPHQNLWVEIQKAIAADGHLRLKPRDRADGIVRIHIFSARTFASGSVESTNAGVPDKDPKILEQIENLEINKPLYRKLDIAGEYATNRNLSYAVKVELIDLRTRNVVFAKTYSAGAAIKAVRPTGLVPQKSHYIVYHEALANQMKSTSNSIARRAVQDMLSQL